MSVRLSEYLSDVSGSNLQFEKYIYTNLKMYIYLKKHSPDIKNDSFDKMKIRASWLEYNFMVNYVAFVISAHNRKIYVSS